MNNCFFRYCKIRINIAIDAAIFYALYLCFCRKEHNLFLHQIHQYDCDIKIYQIEVEIYQLPYTIIITIYYYHLLYTILYMISSTRTISILDHIAIAVPRTSRLMFPFRLIRSMYREDL